MIGNCQGQTELSSPLLPMGVVSSRFLTGRALYASYWERICITQFVFSAPSFCVSLRSTAKRDQSFICAYPASEGLHRRLSLGNPPALKQSFRVYREGLPSLAQAGYSKDRRDLASRIETVMPSSCSGSVAGSAHHPSDFLTRQ